MRSFPNNITIEALLANIDVAIRNAGVAIALGPEGAALVIVDKQQALSWFRCAIAEYDADNT